MKKTFSILFGLVFVVLFCCLISGCGIENTANQEEEIILPARFVMVDDVGDYDAAMVTGYGNRTSFSYVVDAETKNVYILTGTVVSNTKRITGMFPLYDVDGNIYKYDGELNEKS